ncbi:hypothetical protein R4P48_14060 [Atlantibacter subterranea]|uniref:Dit-like phage tail protein N-terminal domain-containing protein n=1 Tax=Atlantibacter subterraneus TaxID=255519 RepID=A0ABU4E3V5_9ENTR|nr:hypothetical protein [Atlantibacter subterranea]MDV7023797.1 hypothetical protein [Atlantibacter subterranea]MDZ5666893.1 hypothetical protein [Atlantibacter hermannii]
MDIQPTLFLQSRRKIGFFFPDVVIKETHNDTLVITEHQVESGAFIADHAYKKPAELTMEVGFAAGALVDLVNGLPFMPQADSDPKELYRQMLDLQQSRIPVEVITGKRIYNNMLLQTISVTTDKLTEYVLNATLTLREIIITQPTMLQAADKKNMTQGVSTSSVQNTGSKNELPVSKPA